MSKENAIYLFHKGSIYVKEVYGNVHYEWIDPRNRNYVPEVESTVICMLKHLKNGTISGTEFLTLVSWVYPFIIHIYFAHVTGVRGLLMIHYL